MHIDREALNCNLVSRIDSFGNSNIVDCLVDKEKYSFPDLQV